MSNGLNDVDHMKLVVAVFLQRTISNVSGASRASYRLHYNNEKQTHRGSYSLHCGNKNPGVSNRIDNSKITFSISYLLVSGSEHWTCKNNMR